MRNTPTTYASVAETFPSGEEKLTSIRHDRILSVAELEVPLPNGLLTCITDINNKNHYVRENIYDLKKGELYPITLIILKVKHLPNSLMCQVVGIPVANIYSFREAYFDNYHGVMVEYGYGDIVEEVYAYNLYHEIKPLIEFSSGMM